MALVYSKTETQIFFYIDWELFGGEQRFEISTNEREKLEFYFGDDNKQESNVESDVTVTNVLLYNRPFDGPEIQNLNKHLIKIDVTPNPSKNKNTDTKLREEKNNTGSGSDQQTPTPLPTNSEEKKEGPSPSRTEDGGVGGGVRVFSLLLPLLCVSALLLHL